MDKHRAMIAFFKPKIEEISAEMNFNFSDDEMNSVAFLTDYADRIKKRYVRVGAIKEYGFTIIVTKEYSPYKDDVNLQAMEFAQSLMDWVDRDTENRDAPEHAESGRCQYGADDGPIHVSVSRHLF